MIRVGIIGIGSIAENYIELYTKGLIKDAHLTAGVMFNNRSRDIDNFVKKHVENEQMGELRRAIWQVTNQYRTYEN